MMGIVGIVRIYVAELRSDLRVRDQDTDRLRTPPQVAVSENRKAGSQSRSNREAQGFGLTSWS